MSFSGTDNQLRNALDEMIDREGRAQRRAILEAVRERFVAPVSVRPSLGARSGLDEYDHYGEQNHPLDPPKSGGGGAE